MRWKALLLTMAMISGAAGAQEPPSPMPGPADDEELIVVSVDALDDSDAPQTIQEALEREHDTFLVKGTLKTALAHLSGLSGVPIAVDWAGLAKIGVTEQTPVLLRTDGQTTQRVLELLLAQASPKGKPIAWRLDGNLVRISSQTVITGAAATARPRRKRNPLTRRLGLTFDQAPLEDALDAVAQTAGVSLHVSWRALLVSGIDRLTPVTVKVEGLTMMAMLDLIVEDASADKDTFDSIYWYIEDGIVRINTGRAMNERLITRTFEIGDMLMVPPHFVGPRIDMAYIRDDPSSGVNLFSDDAEETETAAERRAATKEAILESVTGLLDEEMWDSGGGKGSARIVGTQLIVSQTRLGYLLMARRR